MTNPVEKARNLRGNADSAAGHVRGLYISFLVLAVYIGVIIGSTSDEQLLRVEPVTLPILGVGLPIVAFYALVPWLFVLLHFNILLQHYFLSRKLHLFAAALAEIPDAELRDEQRTQLFSFPFSHLLVPGPEGGLMRLFYGVMVWSTLIILPLAVLLWAQIRFLPYHDIGATWSQRGALLLDVVLLWVFWPHTLTPGLRFADQLKGIAGSWAASKQVALPLSVVSLSVLLVSFFSALVPGEGLERAGLAIRPLTWALFDSPNAPFHRSLKLAEAVLVQGGATPEITAALRGTDVERQRDLLPKISGLVLTDRDLRFADLRGAILAKADLRGAALDGARMSNANLAEANLGPYETAPGSSCASSLAVDPSEIERLAELPDLASFWIQAGVTQPDSERRFKLCRASLKAVTLNHAILQGAVLSFAWIENATLPAARMNGANLSKAVLRNVRAPEAHMEGVRFTLARADGLKLDSARLRLAKLDKAHLKNLTLPGAELTETRFGGAHLEQVDASGITGQRANFTNATLMEVSFTAAKLSGTKFDGAELSDTDFSKADLSQASFVATGFLNPVLNGARLEGAVMADLDLSGGEMRAAVMTGTKLHGSKLVGIQGRGAQLFGADLSDADLRGADLADALIEGSDLSRADLRGSRLTDADLHGVFLGVAKLQGALLEGARFRAVDLSGAALDPSFMNHRLWALGKASSSDSLNLRGARFQRMTREERTDLAKFVAPYARQMPNPWTLEAGDGTEDTVDWRALEGIALCGDRSCLDLESFAESYSMNLRAYACKAAPSRRILLRHFDLRRGDGDQAKAYKHAIVKRLTDSACDPRNELFSRLKHWTTSADSVDN